MTLYAGIDPGKNGGIAVISNQSLSKVQLYKMPETLEDIVELFEFIRFPDEEIFILCESQHARPAYFKKSNPETHEDVFVPARGASSSWTFAQHYGELRGVFAALKFKHVEYVRPQDWMRLLGIQKREKGQSQNDWKNTLQEVARGFFPDMKITKAVSDAALIAVACQRINVLKQKQPKFAFDDI